MPADMPPPLPAILSATERRRTGVTVRLALTVAQQAMEMSGEALGSVSQVSVYDRVKGRKGDVPDKTVGVHSGGGGH